MPSRIKYHRPIGQPTPKQAQQSYEKRPARREDIAFYQSQPWRRLRAAYLAQHPLCERCEAQDRITAASHVHHKVERKDAPALSLVWSNLEALCLSCHSTHHGFKR